MGTKRDRARGPSRSRVGTGIQPGTVPRRTAQARPTGTEENTHGDRGEAGPGDRGTPIPGTDEAAGDTAGTGAHTPKLAAQGARGTVPVAVPDNGDEHAEAAPGTARSGDRPHSDSDAGDQGPADTDAGTEQSGDRPRTVPVKRKPQPEGPRSRSRGGLAKRVGKQPPLTVEQMVERVRPHVPALLERDGNEAVTRVQLRELLRAQGPQDAGTNA